MVEPDDFAPAARASTSAGRTCPLQVERRLFEQRLPAVQAFVRANGLDRVVLGAGARRRLGIVTTGKAYLDVRQALDELGIDERAAEALGLDDLQGGAGVAARARGHRARFARGLEHLLVVEEKRPLIEEQLARLLYDARAAPAPARQARRRRRAAGARPSASSRPATSSRVLRRWLARRAPELAPRLRPPRSAARSPRRAGPDAAAGVLLRLPAQPLDRGARGQRRAGRHRLSRHGGLAARPPHARGDADGRRRRQLDRLRALHRHAAHLPEPRRRHLLPLRACSRSAPPSPPT